MPLRYQALIFDLDGTLLDTLEDLGEAVNYALAKRGFPLHTRDEYAGMVGNGVRKLVERALPGCPIGVGHDGKETVGHDGKEALVDECLADFMAYYEAHIDVHTHPYPGMPELLRDLSAAGARLAVASNKFQSGAEFLVRKIFPDIPFVAILGNSPELPLKPDPAIVEFVLRKAGVGKDAVALVGDSPTDMKTAENAAIPGIAVGWGYRDMCTAPVFAGAVGDLRKILFL